MQKKKRENVKASISAAAAATMCKKRPIERNGHATHTHTHTHTHTRSRNTFEATHAFLGKQRRHPLLQVKTDAQMNVQVFTEKEMLR